MLKFELFKNKIPEHSRRNTFFILFFSGFIFSTTLIYTYLIYSPVLISEIPRINISYNERPDTDNFVTCKFELTSNNAKENINPINSKIKIQGNPAYWRDKKSYRIELPRRISLLGMRKDDDWSLMGMFLDYTRMREKLSIDLWRGLESINPTAILPKTKYVCLYINGEFHGLYLLAERIDRRLFELDDAQNNLDSSLIFQAKYYTNFREYIRDRWEQDWPNEYEGIFIKDQIMLDLLNFIKNSSEKNFFDPLSGIYSIFNKQNLIDFYLFNFFILHKDFWYKNYYIVRNSNPAKFFLVPWDYDASFGQYGWKLYDSNENPEMTIQDQFYLYNRLLNNFEFRKECKDRWIQLREELWTEEYIFDMLSSIQNELKKVLQYEMKLWEPETVDEKPEEDWPDMVIYSTKRFDLDEYINNLYEFIQNRLEFCDIYFGNFSEFSQD